MATHEQANEAGGMTVEEKPHSSGPQSNITPERLLARAVLHVLEDMKARGEQEEAVAFAIFMAEHSDRVASSRETGSDDGGQRPRS